MVQCGGRNTGSLEVERTYHLDLGAKVVEGFVRGINVYVEGWIQGGQRVGKCISGKQEEEKHLRKKILECLKLACALLGKLT